jgi:hypothetical protein
MFQYAIVNIASTFMVISISKQTTTITEDCGVVDMSLSVLTISVCETLTIDLEH